jgi:hypothetical protein
VRQERRPFVCEPRAQVGRALLPFDVGSIISPMSQMLCSTMRASSSIGVTFL